MSQKKREYITGLLAAHGSPAPGTIHTIQKGDEANCENKPLDPDFQPESAVVHLIPKHGTWMDGQCYDSTGHKVFLH